MTRRSTVVRGMLPMVVAAIMLSLSACAAGPATTNGPAGESAATGNGAALRFTGTTLDGATLDGSTLSGKPLVLWFWAPWCTTCRAEGPDVARVAAQYQGRVSFLGVAGRGEVEAMRAFVTDTGTGGFGHLADVSGELWTRFGVVSQPAFVLVDPSGSVQRSVGALDGEQLRTMVEQLAVA
ncbi:MAG: redoxin domain-containing protein [Pseudonocardiales bacterium]|nr:redoxin domain-containing protein [Pseudonocardiales bacterium]